MANTKKTKTTSNKKSRTTQRKKISVTKKEQQIFMYVVIGIILVTLIVSYFLMGTMLTTITGIGIFIILGIARLMDKMNNKPKLRRVLNILIILILMGMKGTLNLL